MQRLGIDFFDVDHTLLRGSSPRHYIVLGVKLGLFPRKNLLQIPVFYLRYRYTEMSSQKTFDRDFPGLTGTERSYLEEVARICFEKKLRGDVFQEARDLISRLKAEGRSVMLATSSIDIIVQPLAEWLGTGLIASSLEFVDGLSTGRFLDGPVFRDTKRTKVLDHIERAGLTPQECSFYSDSIHDLPLLEAIGRPVATNPDGRLKREARSRGWEILNFQR
jgi:HAD superfamily hydrolase (TIGR01490 family)